MNKFNWNGIYRDAIENKHGRLEDSNGQYIMTLGEMLDLMFRRLDKIDKQLKFIEMKGGQDKDGTKTKHRKLG